MLICDIKESLSCSKCSKSIVLSTLLPFGFIRGGFENVRVWQDEFVLVGLSLLDILKLQEAEVIFVFKTFIKSFAKSGSRKKAKGMTVKKMKSKVEIMTDFIKLNDELPVCVAPTVDDLQVLKLQISDSMSAYFTSVVQHLKDVSSYQQDFIIKAVDARKICCSEESTCNLAYKNELLKVRLDESKKRIPFAEEEAKDLTNILNVKMTSDSCNLETF